MQDRNNNQPLQPGIYPDYDAPVVVVNPDGEREMRNMRWGMPTARNIVVQAAEKEADRLRKKGTEFDFAEILKMTPDKGVTNVRRTISEKTGRTNAHWARWLGHPHRCLVPFTSFAEPDQDYEATRKNVWFALDDTRPLAFFAGVWTPYSGVRVKAKGWEDIEAFGFLTTDSAEPVSTFHQKAMPVILTCKKDFDLWLSEAPWKDVQHLQRPSPGLLKIVAEGGKQDDVVPV